MIGFSLTLCNLSMAVSEHKGISFRSGLQLTTPPFSVIREHIHNNWNGTIIYE